MNFNIFMLLNTINKKRYKTSIDFIIKLFTNPYNKFNHFIENFKI